MTTKFFNLTKRLKIEIRHIKGHCGVYGNEIADNLAKKAMKINTIPPVINKKDKTLHYRWEMQMLINNFFNFEITDFSKFEYA